MAEYRPRSPDLSSFQGGAPEPHHHHQQHQPHQPHQPPSAAPEFGANASASYTQNFPSNHHQLPPPDSRPHLPSLSTEHSHSHDYRARSRQASEYGFGSISAIDPVHHSPHSPHPIPSEHPQDWPPPLSHPATCLPSATPDLSSHHYQPHEAHPYPMGAPYGLRSRDPAPAQHPSSSSGGYEPPAPHLKRGSSPYAPPPPHESHHAPFSAAPHDMKQEDVTGDVMSLPAGMHHDDDDADVKSRQPKNLPDPSPVRTRFPTARIKRIMQADEEVGKVAQQTPIAVGKALELFMVQMVLNSADVARDKGSKRVTAPMLKQVVEEDDQWDFLRDIVAKVEEGKKGKESESEEDEVKKKGKGGRKKKAAAA